MSVDKREQPIVVNTQADLWCLTNDIRRQGRDYAIVALAIIGGADGAAFVPNTVAAALGRDAPIYVLRSIYFCRRLADAVGRPLGVDGGEARIWWPGVAPDSDPAGHPRVSAQSEAGGDAVERLISAFELSRPRVRRHLQLMADRLETSEWQALQRLVELRVSRAAWKEAVARAETAERGLATAEEQLNALRAGRV